MVSDGSLQVLGFEVEESYYRFGTAVPFDFQAYFELDGFFGL